MSAIPYYFNLALAECAVEAGVHFCDLGGNTEIVFQQKELADRAAAKDITVVPDCGVAPGMVNILAEYGIRQLDTVDSVQIYVGGLPQHPEPPLNYQVVYSLEGVLDYYTTLSWVLRNGKRTQVNALSEREPVEFPAAGRHARGVPHRGRPVDDGVPLRGQDPDDGVQDAPLSRTRGDHGDDSRARPARPGAGRREGHEGRAARRCSSRVVGPKLTKPKGKDLLALRVDRAAARRTASRRSVASTSSTGTTRRHGISAMMRTTGYSLSITGQMQVRGEVRPPGVWTPDECMPPQAYIAELAKRGIDIEGDVALSASD